MSDEVIVTIIGISLIVFVLWFFLAPVKDEKSSGHEHDH